MADADDLNLPVDNLANSNANLMDVNDVGCCNPRIGYYRFGGLVFMCFLGFGSYFCYDTPGSLQDQIKEDMDVNTVQFASLYSLYSWPNVVLCFVGGFLIDRVFGIGMGAVIFSVLVTLGQFVYAFGALANQFWLMQLGRFIFGVGGESLAVAQNTYAVAWFKGKELNTVFGLQLSMARVGSTVNFLTMGPIYAWVDVGYDGNVALGYTLLIAGLFCIFSLACAIILALLHRRRTKVLHVDNAETVEKVQLKDIFTFPLSFWLISVICVTYYVAIFPFIGLAKVFFMRKYEFNEENANGVSSIVYIISAFASPVLGYVVDRTGRNIMWVFIAIVLTIGCHATLAFSFLNPYVPMAVMGIAYSLLASSLWPMVSLVVPEHQLGSAYGGMQSIQNLGLALISMLGGYIVDTKGYFLLEIFFLIWLCIALAATVTIWFTDASYNGGLNLSVNQRDKIDDHVERENYKYSKLSGVEKGREENEFNSTDDETIKLQLLGQDQYKSNANSVPCNLLTVYEKIVERPIVNGETLRSIALKYRIPISELKRVNRIFQETEFFALSAVKIPVKPNSILSEILEKENQSDDNKEGTQLTQGVRHGSSSSSVSEIESPLREMHVGYISINQIMRDTQTQSEARHFLANMQRDLVAMRNANDSRKSSLGDAASTLTQVRFKSLKHDDLSCSGSDWGIRWWKVTVIALVMLVGLPLFYIFVFLPSQQATIEPH